MDLVTNVGVFIYPLIVCSLIAVFVTVERLIFLSASRVVDSDVVNALVQGDLQAVSGNSNSAMGRVIRFWREQSPNAEALVAFARMEISKLERGLFLLEAVIGAAPLIGLLGTVTGLTQVFGDFFAESGLTDTKAFTSGIAMALNTTILGLVIAIPSLVAHAYILRRIDWFSVRIHMGVECLSKSMLKNPNS